MDRKEKSCGCVVFNQENDVLLVKMHQGHWSFPKGHVEAMESEQETALRETKEETNLNCTLLDGFREVTAYSPAKNVMKEVVFFVGLASSKAMKKQLEEIKEVGFYPFEQAMRLLTFNNDKSVLQKAYQFYMNRS